MEEVKQVYETLAKANPEAAAYILPNAFNRRVLLEMNLRSARHFIRLRSAPNAHFAIRRVAQRLADEAQARFPLFMITSPPTVETWQPSARNISQGISDHEILNLFWNKEQKRLRMLCGDALSPVGFRVLFRIRFFNGAFGLFFLPKTGRFPPVQIGLARRYSWQAGCSIAANLPVSVFTSTGSGGADSVRESCWAPC